ncbi:caspase family protein [Rhizobium leguminosarum]|uniref:caspase family protein n=1 Tax=Rhizobium leguminosarum TaxID=384 RepID=UPI003F9D45E5
MASRTVAILLGASAWPKAPDRLPGTKNFAHSAQDFRRYLTDANGLAIPEDQLLNLFDDERPPDQIDEKISNFLSESTERLGDEIENLILFYVGHGLFSEDGHKYCLALRSTRPDSIGASAYRFSSLARTLNRNARNAKRFVIIDACFAAAALPDMMPQSQAGELAEAQIISDLASSGTALLCAASSSDVAVTPKNARHTMFSEALLNALTGDTKRHGASLSFDDIRDEVDSFISARWRDQAVKPELHIPDQRKGDISRIAFFPNIFGRSALHQAEELQETIARTEKLRSEFETLRVRVEKLEELRATQDQPKESQSIDANLSEPPPYESMLPYHVQSGLSQMRSGHIWGLRLLMVSICALCCNVTLLVYCSYIAIIPDVAKYFGIVSGVLSLSFFVLLLAGLFCSRGERQTFVKEGEIIHEWQKQAYKLQIHSFRRLYYAYLIELQFVFISLPVLALASFTFWVTAIQFY